MTHCPCCSNQMLRHIRLQEAYWFCRRCWQKMPDLASETNKNFLGLAVIGTSAIREQIYTNSGS